MLSKRLTIPATSFYTSKIKSVTPISRLVKTEMGWGKEYSIPEWQSSMGKAVHGWFWSSKWNDMVGNGELVDGGGNGSLENHLK